MPRYSIMITIVLLGLAIISTLSNTDAQTQTKMRLQGWLSDEACARPRANNGIFTPTNPDCARDCVAKGENVVLILADRKQIVRLVRSDLIRANVGNYVNLTVHPAPGSTQMMVDSLKTLTVGRARCLAKPPVSGQR